MVPIQERVIGHKAEQYAEEYLKRFPEQINHLESNSVLSKLRSITPYDVFAVGTQLDQFEEYRKICEEDGSIAHLGKIPTVAYDVITVTYGNSPISAMASIQPIDEEKGIVYFKDVVAQTSRGNMSEGDRVFSPNDISGTVPIKSYAGDTIINEDVGDTASGTQSYTGNLVNIPVRPEKVTITVPGVMDSNGNPLTCTDNGNGVLTGFEIYGTITYSGPTAGAFTLELANDPAGTFDIFATYSQDFEQSADIPKIIQKFNNKTVEAKIWALKDTMGMHQSFALRKRHGLVLEDEVAQDLVAAINSEIVNSAIGQLMANAQGNHNWQKPAPGGISYTEHKQTFKDAIAEAESNMLSVAGRGAVNVMIVGRGAASVIQTLPGFTKISDGSSIGPHVWGILDGITVIRVVNDNILPNDKVICMFKGPSNFEAALVYAPYMPLVSTATLPTGTNPLLQQKAVAVWSALDVIVKNFITTITLTPAP